MFYLAGKKKHKMCMLRCGCCEVCRRTNFELSSWVLYCTYFDNHNNKEAKFIS